MVLTYFFLAQNFSYSQFTGWDYKKMKLLNNKIKNFIFGLFNNLLG